MPILNIVIILSNLLSFTVPSVMRAKRKRGTLTMMMSVHYPSVSPCIWWLHSGILIPCCRHNEADDALTGNTVVMAQTSSCVHTRVYQEQQSHSTLCSHHYRTGVSFITLNNKTDKYRQSWEKHYNITCQCSLVQCQHWRLSHHGRWPSQIMPSLISLKPLTYPNCSLLN